MALIERSTENVKYGFEVQLREMTSRDLSWATLEEMAVRAIQAGWPSVVMVENNESRREIYVRDSGHPQYLAAVAQFAMYALHGMPYLTFTPRTLEDHRAVAAAVRSILEWKGEQLPPAAGRTLPEETRRELQTMLRLTPVRHAATLPSMRR